MRNLKHIKGSTVPEQIASIDSFLESLRARKPDKSLKPPRTPIVICGHGTVDSGSKIALSFTAFARIHFRLARVLVAAKDIPVNIHVGIFKSVDNSTVTTTIPEVTYGAHSKDISVILDNGDFLTVNIEKQDPGKIDPVNVYVGILGEEMVYEGV